MQKFLRYFAVASNVLFILWIIYNAIDSGFQGHLTEIIALISLMILLALNSWLLLARRR